MFWRPYANWNLAAPVGDHEAISANIIEAYNIKYMTSRNRSQNTQTDTSHVVYYKIQLYKWNNTFWSSCIHSRWGGPDGIEAWSFGPIFLQCFDTVGWVIWPVKTRPHMTYNVLVGR